MIYDMHYIFVQMRGITLHITLCSEAGRCLAQADQQLLGKDTDTGHLTLREREYQSSFPCPVMEQ